jgi:DNA gyrase inhibitor GyrI
MKVEQAEAYQRESLRMRGENKTLRDKIRQLMAYQTGNGLGQVVSEPPSPRYQDDGEIDLLK